MDENGLTPTAQRIASAINKLYAETNPRWHDQIDYARDEIAHALALAGLCTTTAFNHAARSIEL